MLILLTCQMISFSLNIYAFKVKDVHLRLMISLLSGSFAEKAPKGLLGPCSDPPL
jgi:hypothetical protein